MKTKPSVLLSVLLFLCAIGQVVYGQYAPRSSPPSLPLDAYGSQYGPAYSPPRPSYPSAMPPTEFSPYMAAPQFAVPYAVPRTALAGFTGSFEGPDTAAVSKKGGKRPFRVFLAGDKDGVPDKEITLASTLKEKGKRDSHGNLFGAKGGKEKCPPYYNFRFFGEYLLLRARDAEVAYAVEANLNPPAPDLPPIQTSPVALLDQHYSSGYRFGCGVSLDEWSELAIAYTSFDTSTDHQISRTDPTRFIYPMAIHPATRVAVTGRFEASGRHDISFGLADVDYRQTFIDDPLTDLTGLLGVRWGQLQQGFAARYTDDLLAPIDETNVWTDIDFRGIGVRAGLEGERYASRWPLMVYAKCWASLMAGEFDASYRQTIQNNANVGVNTAWTAGRIVPTFDLELGGGLVCCDGRIRATAGYLFSAWTNTVKTEDWINAVQTNDFRDMNDTMTFDGLVVRIEGRF